MKIGVMNNPRKDTVGEIKLAAEHGFDFIDLTLEYPEAHIDSVDRDALARSIEESGLRVVGHTAYYLPFASPINSIREAAILDVIKCLDLFKQVGAELVTVHPDPGVGAVEPSTTTSLNALSFKIISDEAAKLDLTIAVENIPWAFSSVEPLQFIFKSVPSLGFHLDVGHACIGRNRFKHLLSTFKSRLRHVHLSDNRMRADDHMPIGAGNIDWEEIVAALKGSGYDATITLEVFSNDPRYVLASKEKVQSLWSRV